MDLQPVTYSNALSRPSQGSGNTTPIIIAVFGRTGTGKTTLIKNLSGDKNLKVGGGMKSTTKTVESVRCTINNQPVILVDTPGFDDTDLTDTQVLTKIAEWLKYYYDENTLLSGLIFLHSLLDNKMSGSSIKNLRMFRKLCGDHNLRNVTLATTMWSDVPQEKGLRRESELHTEFWRELVELGSRVDRVCNDAEQDKKLVLDLAQNQSVVLQLQDELARGLNLTQTQVGAVLNTQLAHLVAQCTKDLERARRELKSSHNEEVKELKKKLEQMKADQADLVHRKVATVARATRRWYQCSWRCLEGCGSKTRREGLWTCRSCGREQNNVFY